MPPNNSHDTTSTQLDATSTIKEHTDPVAPNCRCAEDITALHVEAIGVGDSVALLNCQVAEQAMELRRMQRLLEDESRARFELETELARVMARLDLAAVKFTELAAAVRNGQGAE